jgi:5-methylcytosine-specific restriction endonuclease McrA
MRKAFIAKNHKCWFSSNPEYKGLTVDHVIDKDPGYMIWCYDNLKHLRFATGIENKIKALKKEAGVIK